MGPLGKDKDKALPSFWIPSLTPEAKATKLEKPVSAQGQDSCRCSLPPPPTPLPLPTRLSLTVPLLCL